MVALDKQFFHHHGTKPQGRGRWRDETWQTGKTPGRRTADILFARSHRDTSNSSNTSCANEIIYCGHRFDAETQLYYVRNRTYNAVLGRWIQRDPIGYSGGINLYGYVESSPAGKVDPLGYGAMPLPVPAPYTGPNPIDRIYPEPPLPEPIAEPIGIGGTIAGAGLAIGAAGLAIWAWSWKLPEQAQNEFSAETQAANALAVAIGGWNREAAALKRKRKCYKGPCQIHHIATDKDPTWKADFAKEFARAGMVLGQMANLCKVCDVGDGLTHAQRHAGGGGHPDGYHKWVHGQIGQYTSGQDAAAWTISQKAECLKSLLNLLYQQLDTSGIPYRTLITKPVPAPK